INRGAKALTVGACAMRRIERKGTRRHLRHAETAIDTREPPRKQSVPPVVRVDDNDVFGKMKRHLDRLGESALDSPPDDDPIDDDFNRVIAPTVQLDVVFESAELAVDPRFRETPPPQRGDLFLEFALAASNNRRQDVDPFFL